MRMMHKDDTVAHLLTGTDGGRQVKDALPGRLMSPK